MIRQILKNKLFMVVMVCMSVVSLSAPAAYAWGGHHYRGGRWYDDGWFWAGAGLTALAVGEMIASLPPGYTTVYAGGAPYYYAGNTYFVYSPRGYMVVPPPAGMPVVAAAPMTYAPQVPMVPVSPSSVAASSVTVASVPSSDTFDIYVPNADGTYSLVTLKRTDKGYIGPQGEFYPEHPTVEKLKVLYGKTNSKT